jgi:hypothetical protein
VSAADYSHLVLGAKIRLVDPDHCAVDSLGRTLDGTKDWTFCGPDINNPGKVLVSYELWPLPVINPAHEGVDPALFKMNSWV